MQRPNVTLATSSEHSKYETEARLKMRSHEKKEAKYEEKTKRANQLVDCGNECSYWKERMRQKNVLSVASRNKWKKIA